MQNNLRTILKKFKKEEFRDVLGKWGRCPVVDISFKTKMEWMRYVLENSENVDSEDLAQLDLIFIQEHVSCKLWTLFNFTKIPGCPRTEAAETFVEDIDREVQLYFRSDVSLRVANGLYWLRICFHNRRSSVLTNDVVYVVYVPNTNFVFATPMKKAYVTGLTQAIMMAIDGHQPVQGHLQGRNLFSLLQLLESRIRQLNDDEEMCEHLFTYLDRQPEDDDLPEEIVHENLYERKKRLTTAEKVFGHHLQPSLEKVVYSLATPFKSRFVPADVFGRDEAFDCQVTFRGSNVVEGIRKLMEAGLADPPVHLREIHTRAQTTFRIKPRGRRAGGNTSIAANIN